MNHTKCKHLIIGDNEINRIILKMMLEKNNIDVDEVDNIEELYIFIENKQKYDIIWIDVPRSNTNQNSYSHIIKNTNNFEGYVIEIVNKNDDNTFLENQITRPLTNDVIKNIIKKQQYQYNVVNNNKIINPIKNDLVKNTTNVQTGRHLVVDDNEINRMVIKSLLERRGFQIDEVVDGTDVIKLIKKKNKYDVIWMDVNMQNMNGTECTHILRTQYNYKNKIIGLTGFVDDHSIKQFKMCGMDDVMGKPIMCETLDKILKEILDK